MLEELLVLKGGNALELVHRLGSRASVDLDFSLEEDADPGSLAERLERALRDRFDALDASSSISHSSRVRAPAVPVFAGADTEPRSS